MTRHPAPDAPSDSPSRARLQPRSQGGLAAGLDALAFSNVLPAAIAASLSLASSRALGATAASDSARLFAVLAASGAFVVYGLDRLRDTLRDRSTSPLRTNFIERHRTQLAVATGLAALVLTAAIAVAPLPVALLCGGAGAIGLLHRRLKAWSSAKALYVSATWVAVCAGIPAVAAGFDFRFAWLAGILFAAFSANLVASNLRDDEIQLLRGQPEAALRISRAAAIAGVGIACFAPLELRPLAWIPLAEAIALVFFRPSEHYGQLAVDGALLVGALASLTHQGLG